MTFAIMRTQKLKSAVAVRSSLKHTFRDQETPNADEALRENNVILHGANSTTEAMRDFRAKLPEKIRKNGVQCVELLITASHDVMMSKDKSEQIAYFQDSLEWIGEKFGGKENIINAGVHYDERTPHMYVYVVPLDEKGKLNCRKFLGGSKHVMSDLQDSFANEVGKKHGLERGLKGSKAKHQTIGNYYKKLNASISNVVFTIDDLTPKTSASSGILGKIGFMVDKEHPEAVVYRLNQRVSSLVAKAQDRDFYLKNRAEEVKKINRLDNFVERVNHQFRSLDKDEIEKVKAYADKLREEKRAAKEQADKNYFLKRMEEKRAQREAQELLKGRGRR